MAEHPSVTVIKKATEAIVTGDRDQIAQYVNENLTFRVRGHLPGEGDYEGIDAFLEVVGRWFEMTDGAIELQDLYLGAEGDRAVQWEQAVLGSGDRRVVTENAWTFRLADGRITEMTVLSGVTATEAAIFSTPVG